jgi:regulator of replication initiation timing
MVEETLKRYADDVTVQELVRLRVENERLREALHQWDALIKHQYSGSRQAMSELTNAAQNTAQILYGDPPWPDPKPRAALKGDE